MNRTIFIILILILVLFLLIFLFLDFKNESSGSKEKIPETSELDTQNKLTLKEIVYSFIGKPYQRGPLGEKQGEQIYRTDVFDCTTLVLVSVARFVSNDINPEETMKRINYYPEKEVSYETRLHFSSYRNKVSPFFKDITSEIGKEKTKYKKIVLNKDRGEGLGRIINIDWEKEITLDYIEKQDILSIISAIPSEVGIGFIIDADEKIGLDIRHEGFLFDRNKLVHASLNKGKVTEENFIDFLNNSDYDGVIFFKIN